jgi:hypothetical protein
VRVPPKTSFPELISKRYNHQKKKTSSKIDVPRPEELYSPAIRERLDNQNVVKVVLLSVNPRSGSTYLSEILSSPPMTSLWQEPMRFLYEDPPKTLPASSRYYQGRLPHDEVTTVANDAKDKSKDHRYRRYVDPNEKVQLLADFMDCKFTNYTEFMASQVSRKFIFKLPSPALGKARGRVTKMMLSRVFMRKTFEECRKTKLRIMKTIRLDVEDLVQDLRKKSKSLVDPDYKVIVLFRDPRGIMTSVKVSPDFWNDDVNNANWICSQIIKNFEAIQSLGMDSRVQIVKYEDLVDDKLSVFQSLYKFMNISYLMPFPRYYMNEHIKAEQEKKWNKVLEGENIPAPQEPPKMFLAQRLKNKFKARASNVTQSFEEFYSKLSTKRKKKFFKAKKFNTLLDGGMYRYYSTNRAEDFRHDHWKEEIPQWLLDEIQEKSKLCQKAMNLLGYEKYHMTNND